MIALKMTKDITGHNSFGLPFPDPSLCFRVVLSNNVVQNLIVPDNTSSDYPCYLAIIESGQGVDIWVSKNNTVSLPTNTSFQQNNSILNPGPMEVLPGDSLSFVTNSTSAYVGVRFYNIKRG